MRSIQIIEIDILKQDGPTTVGSQINHNAVVGLGEQQIIKAPDRAESAQINRVLGRAEVADDIGTVTGLENERVRVAIAVEGIVASAACERIVAGAAFEDIIVGAPLEKIAISSEAGTGWPKCRIKCLSTTYCGWTLNMAALGQEWCPPSDDTSIGYGARIFTPDRNDDRFLAFGQ